MIDERTDRPRATHNWLGSSRVSDSAFCRCVDVPLALAAFVLVLMWVAQSLQGSYGTRTMLEDQPAPRRWAVYYLLTFSTVLFFGISNQNFIYFQF